MADIIDDKSTAPAIDYEVPENFIGVIHVKGYRGVNDTGEDGYWLLIDPEKSNKKYWIPKAKFDSIYSRVVDLSKISDKDLEELVSQFIFKKIDERTIMGVAVLKTGFRIYATASNMSNSPDRSKGVAICKEKLFIKLRSFLGFTIQWGTIGLIGRTVMNSGAKYIDLTDLDDLDI